MKRDGSQIPKDNLGNFTPRLLKPRLQKDQPIAIEKPVRSIGRFFGNLPRNVQTDTTKWSRTAGHLPRGAIEAGYSRLASIAEHANYA